MGMCPYCGESIADTAAQCTRCGMVLDESAAPPAEEEAPPARGGKSLGARAGAGAGTEAKKKFAPCPKCDKPVPVKAHRCPSCGHKIREVVDRETRRANEAFSRNVKLGVFGAIGFVVLLFLAIGVFKGGGGRKGNLDWAKVTYADLSSLVGPAAKGSAVRQKDNWAKYYGKFVRWEGRVLEVHAGGLFGDATLLIRQRDGVGEADVRLDLPRPELEKSPVAAGQRVGYSGRLVDYGGDPPFTLADGAIHSVK